MIVLINIIRAVDKEVRFHLEMIINNNSLNDARFGCYLEYFRLVLFYWIIWTVLPLNEPHKLFSADQTFLFLISEHQSVSSQGLFFPARWSFLTPTAETTLIQHMFWTTFLHFRVLPRDQWPVHVIGSWPMQQTSVQGTPSPGRITVNHTHTFALTLMGVPHELCHFESSAALLYLWPK